ncbi:MAG: GNAT family N-acetyltransferase [Dehalococcoidia bacterium]|jgi:putative acetyltransferase|nr:GNAT family N-acetyltransferase [Dehalococcoidia bacterium]|tara:strand:+ start:121 stop:567 length:447 start_codon:yes stop_codon:yes gene_type:complete
MKIELQKEINNHVLEIIKLGDQYLESLYPPESNHLVRVSDLISDWFEFYLMKDENKIIGSIGISFKHINPEIKRMFIRTEFRGMGYSHKLLNFIVNRCDKLGYKKIQLETGISQPEAISVYEKHGFRRIRPFNDYKEDPLSIFFELNI